LDALDMVRDVSDQEVKTAIFSMGNDKAPGLDGFTAAFFKEAWNVIAIDVTHAVREFFRNGTLLKELNHTIIALIPKVKSPSRVNDYRPISCCNVLFKCISKIIANRIKHGLKTIISPNQSAFVPGRSITDNILLTQELMHNYHLDRGSPRCAFKVDIQKAYDTVDWDFLQALDEFKKASGLVPSLPKSTAYFCNVLNHVKLSILQALLFEEGKGKSKVAWESVCLPKDEGSLELIGCFMAHRDMARAGLTPNSKVHDIIINGTWLWPHDLIAKFSVLNNYNVPTNEDDVDRLVWRDIHGNVKKIRYPKFGMISDFVIRRKLKTQDLIPAWDVSSSLGVVCSLCESNPDLQDHLFFECPVSCGIWNGVKGLAGLNASNPNIYDIIQDLLPIVKHRTTVSVIAKLVVAASAYYVWQERNWRLFKKGKRNSDQIVECIVSSVRLKILSCKLKKSKSGERMARLWDLPEVIFI
nr:putative RNA-directed DNA polymerase, eukaryota, reverse transcriptase zinc-binding domain protein [Tanacetum cinerariifolium]